MGEFSDDLLNVAPPKPTAETEEFSGTLLGDVPASVRRPTVNQDTEGAAGILDVAIASLMDDPQAQMNFFSRAMNIPRERFGVIGGQIVFQTDSGEFQAVQPGALRGIARGAGPSLPAVGGAAGGILGFGAGIPTGPTAVATTAAGGMAGAAAGQTVREFLGTVLGDQEPSGGRIVKEAGLDLASTVVGLGIAKGASRAAASRLGQEFGRVMSAGGKQASEALKEALDTVNREFGSNIQLTPAELSNSAKLRAQQLGLQNKGEVAQPLEDFVSRRGDETRVATEGFLDTVSQQADPDVAGRQLSTAAEKGLRDITQERVSAGSPVYQQAFQEAESLGGVDIRPTVQFLDETAASFPPAREPLERIRNALGVLVDRGDGVRQFQPFDNLEQLQDTAKEMLDDEIGTAARAGKNKLAGRLRNVQNNLLDTLDQQVPTFAEARRLWGDLSRPVSQAEGGVLPQLASRGQKDFEYLGTRFLSRSSPAEIRRARSRILRVGDIGDPASAFAGQLGGGAGLTGQDAWNASLRGFLQEAWQQAGREFKSTIGRPGVGRAAQPVTFFARMFGDPAQQARLKAAMTPQQFSSFEKLMRVFEATGRATNFNSTTAAQQEARTMLESTGLGQAVLQNVLDIPGIPKRAGGAVNDAFQAKHLEELVNVITNTDSVKELLKITSQNFNRDRGLLLVGKALNLARANAEVRFNGPRDQLPQTAVP